VLGERRAGPLGQRSLPTEPRVAVVETLAVLGEASRRKEKSPDWVNQSGLIISGNVLLSHNLEMHYHRGCSVSLPCSEWERVGPLRNDHQTWGLLGGR
jgi:hypothetical protein